MNTESSFTLSRIHEHFHDEEMARTFLEKLRWPDGPVCPKCGEIGNARKLEARADSKKPVRKGVWKCYGCCEQFLRPKPYLINFHDAS